MLTVPATAPARPAVVRREVQLGRSQRGRPIVAWEIGDAHSRNVELVVGCIHGNEPAGIAIATRLTHLRPPAGTLLWVVPDVNPNGVAAGTRQNARGIDLNRNFPTRWLRRGRRGSTFYSGARPLSEWESRIAAALVWRVHPRVSIWFHQHLDLVDASGGDRGIERRFARLAGMRTGVLPRYRGSAVTWETRRSRRRPRSWWSFRQGRCPRHASVCSCVPSKPSRVGRRARRPAARRSARRGRRGADARGARRGERARSA